MPFQAPARSPRIDSVYDKHPEFAKAFGVREPEYQDALSVHTAKKGMPDLGKKNTSLPDIDWGGITNVNSPSGLDTPFSLGSDFEFDPLPSTRIELKSPQQLGLENRNYLPDFKFEDYVTEANESEGPAYDTIRGLKRAAEQIERDKKYDNEPFPFTDTPEGQAAHDADLERMQRREEDLANVLSQLDVAKGLYVDAPANLDNPFQPDVLGGNKSAPVWSTSLGEQVAPYYQNVPGGFDAVVDSAIEAQENRGNRPGHYELMMEGYPRWNREDLDARIPIMGGPQSGSHGQYRPAPVYPSTAWGRYDDPLMDELIPKGRYPANPGQIFLKPPWTQKKDHWTDKGDLMNALLADDSDALHGMPNPYLPLKYWPGLKTTIDHELTHAAIGGTGMSGEMSPTTVKGQLYDAPPIRYEDYPFLAEKPGPLYLGGGKDAFNYYVKPAEMDPRIAEIKRAYAAITGKNITTIEEAKQAWEWYKEQRKAGWRGGGWPSGYEGDPAPFDNNAWFLEKVLEEDPVIMQQIYNRLLEIVGAPTTQPGVNV